MSRTPHAVVLGLTLVACGSSGGDDSTGAPDSGLASPSGGSGGSAAGPWGGDAARGGGLPTSPGGSAGTGAGAATTGGSGTGGAGTGGASAGTGGTVGPADAAAPPSADAATSAGPRTVFSTDPGEFFGDSRCTGLDVIVCEDFEAGSVPVGAIWEQSSWPRPGNAGEPQIRVDGVHTARGQGALHLTVDDGSEAYLSTSAPFPAPGNTFYGRVFFYVESPVPQQDYTVHWNLVEALGPAMQGAESYTSKIRYGGTYNPFNEGYIFNVEAQPRPSGFNEFGTGDGHGLEENEWVCVEWMFGDGPEGRLWRNGVEVPELHVGSPVDGVSYEMPPFDAVKIGWAIYQQVDVPFEVWIDEIALDHERIGCQR